MKTLQIRNVPDDVHRRLKARAAHEGRSLSELALSELRRSLERPTWAEWQQRLAQREPFEVPGGGAAAVQAGRENRGGREDSDDRVGHRDDARLPARRRGERGRR